MDSQDNSLQPLPQVDASQDPAGSDASAVLPVASNDDTASQQQAAGQNIPIDETPDTAEDVDLIEKAWVEKAKSIVNETQGNPYEQNERLTKMKADYLKKRYDKNIGTEG